MSELTIHPAAAIFPMMSEEELQDLAADIKAHGLAHPIIIHENGDGRQLIDGRNRLRACEIAGVEPSFKEFVGDDPRAFILSVNVARRHLSKGQQAMAVAMLYPEPEKGGRGKKKTVETTGFSPERLSRARTVQNFSVPLAEAVLAGTAKLDEAYDQAQLGSGRLKNAAVRIRKLREARPDLADKVDGEELSLDEAEDRAKREAEEIKQQRWAASVNLIDAVRLLDISDTDAINVVRSFDPAVAASRGEEMTVGRLRKAAAALAIIIQNWGAK